MRGEVGDADERVDASQLARLQEFERDLARALDEARTGSRHVLEQAREEADRLEADARAALDREAERLRVSCRSDVDERIRVTLAEARARARRYASLSENEVAELARQALRWMVDGEDPS